MRLHANEAILNKVHAADAMRTADGIQAFDDFCRRKFFAIYRNRIATFKFDFHIFALFRRILRRGGNLIHHFFGFIPRVFEQTAFMREMPEI